MHLVCISLRLSMLWQITGQLPAPVFHSDLIFPAEHWHNHASCIVECPNGDLLACWYNGSGERNADDVKVEGARKRKGAKGMGTEIHVGRHPWISGHESVHVH
jgi:hypothetical protein